ncbi:TPA: WIAG tail domain protein [Thermocrinis Great Boiling Spring virus]|nr:TPA: WIAG tail domain protein [Thermocrinis Great Boiling Spring virus]
MPLYGFQSILIHTDEIANDAITTEKIKDFAITTNKIANNAITTEKIVNNAITTEKLANNAITTNKIADNAITESKIQDNAISTAKIRDGAITTNKIANNAITTEKIANSSITTEKFHPSAIAPNSDKLDGFDASLTPAPNVIVPLNAEGILDLSATYVKSNVYTFRRVDLTGVASDYELQIGEEAYIEFSNATTVPLRIATSSGTLYECDLVCSNTGGTSWGTGYPVFLNPNNTTYSGAFVYAEFWRSSTEAGSSYVSYSAFRIGYNFTHGRFIIENFVQIKSIIGCYNLWGQSNGFPLLVIFSTNWRDTTTPWTSLGTITFPQSTSGYILIRRLR